MPASSHAPQSSVGSQNNAAYFPKPRLALAALEAVRVPFEALALKTSSSYLDRLPQGDGHPVMVLPPYMASDKITATLRKQIDRWGYEDFGWGLGTNLGSTEMNTIRGAILERDRLLEELERRLQRLYEARQRKISLIGWSLGGLHACQLAQRNPDLVRQVITLGSPLGDPRGTAIFSIMQSITGSEPSEQEIQDWVADLDQPLDNIPLSCVYSRGDGIVIPEIAQKTASSTTQNIEVNSSHCGMAYNRRVFYIIGDRLAQPEDNWQPFEAGKLQKLFVA